jgi:3-hydroxyacyl-[acyl-carrier-protein] dehydratase
VPSLPLVDLSTIDLTAVAADAATVGRFNPQAGDMRMLDHIVWVSSDGGRGLGVRFIRHDEFWIPGHIPGRPLLPGVLMIEAGAQLASFMQKNKYNREGFLGFTRCDDTVFRGQVVPGDTLYLAGQEVESTARRFISRVQGLVNGKIVFESTVTGMIM